MTTHIQRSALLPYPAQALYDLVNDVASYPQFLPWCSSAEILESTEVLMRASLGVAKGGLSQHFVTRNTLVPGRSIEMNLEEGPFTKLHGLWVVVFAGWIMGRGAVRDELSMRSPVMFALTLFLMRYVAPLGILIVFAAQLWK